MKKSIFILTAFLSLSAIFSESKYSKYYENLPIPIAQVEEFKIPEKRFSVLDFGAVADGKTLNTKAIQKAIDQVSTTGGHLDFPAGTYLIGPIDLKSNVDLHLEKGALIQFSSDKTLYLNPNGKSVRHFIFAQNCKNISITGEGIIDGNGSYWWGIGRKRVTEEYWKACLARGGVVASSQRGESWFPYGLKDGSKCIGKDYAEQEKLRACYIFRPEECQNVLVENVTFRNSPKMAFFPTRIENLIVDGLKVEAPVFSPNTDAVDISVCRRVLIVNSVLDCGDDGFIMKGGSPSEGAIKKNTNFGDFSDILISDCHTLNSHCGFGLGSENVHGLKNVVVKNCIFENATVSGIEFKTPAGRAGITKNIWCYDIEIKNANNAVLFTTSFEDKGMLYSATGNDDKTKFLPDLQDVHFKNIKATGSQNNSIKIAGLSEKNTVHDLTFENCDFESNKSALDFVYAKNISFKNCSFKSKGGDFAKKHTEFVTFENTTINGKDYKKNQGSLEEENQRLTVFDFSQEIKRLSEKKTSVTNLKVSPASGKSATLSLTGNFSIQKAELVLSKQAIGAKSFSKADCLNLTLEKDSEIAVSFRGAGSSDTEKRFLVLADSSKKAIEQFDNLDDKRLLLSKLLKKGSYKIFTNGTRISSIEIVATE